MDRFFLFILDFFRGAYESMQVDYAQLRSIVKVKLMMDNRRQTNTLGQQQQRGKRGYILTQVVYLVLGFLVSFLIYVVPSAMISMSIVFAYIMVMVIMILITDFSSVLLDTSDNSIILPRPVSNRTLLAARLTHIVIYVGMLTLSISLGAVVAVTITFGWFALLAFLICVVLGVLFSITITNGLYLLLMKYTSEERLKNAINYLQIVMTIFFIGAYQIFPRMMGTIENWNSVFTFDWWTYLLPPVWFSATVEAVDLFLFDAPHVIMLLLAVSIPIVSLYLVSTYLAPAFAEKLQDMATESRPVKNADTTANKVTLASRFVGWFTKPGVERAGFIATQKALGRDRKLKLKIYPSIGSLFVVLVVIFVRFSTDEDLSGDWYNRVTESNAHLLLIYFTSMVMYTTYFEISFSDDYKASWIYSSSPIKVPGELLMGSLKAIAASFFLPIYLIMSIIILVFWGERAIGDLVFGILNNLVIVLSIALINRKIIPLTLPETARNNAGGNFARGIMMMFVMAFLGFLHYGAIQISWALWLLIPMFAVILYFMQKSYREIRWADMKVN